MAARPAHGAAGAGFHHRPRHLDTPERWGYVIQPARCHGQLYLPAHGTSSSTATPIARALTFAAASCERAVRQSADRAGQKVFHQRRKASASRGTATGTPRTPIFHADKSFVTLRRLKYDINTAQERSSSRPSPAARRPARVGEIRGVSSAPDFSMNKGLLIFAAVAGAASSAMRKRRIPGRVLFRLISAVSFHASARVDGVSGAGAKRFRGRRGERSSSFFFIARPDDPSFIPGPKSLNEAWIASRESAPDPPLAGAQETGALATCSRRRATASPSLPPLPETKAMSAPPRRGSMLLEDGAAHHRRGHALDANWRGHRCAASLFGKSDARGSEKEPPGDQSLFSAATDSRPSRSALDPRCRYGRSRPPAPQAVPAARNAGGFPRPPQTSTGSDDRRRGRQSRFHKRRKKRWAAVSSATWGIANAFSRVATL